MTKADLITNVSKETRINQETTKLVTESLLDNIQKSLESEESVFLRGFGTFTVKAKAPKKARNISTGAVIDIPARKKKFLKFADPYLK